MSWPRTQKVHDRVAVCRLDLVKNRPPSHRVVIELSYVLGADIFNPKGIDTTTGGSSLRPSTPRSFTRRMCHKVLDIAKFSGVRGSREYTSTLNLTCTEDFTKVMNDATKTRLFEYFW